MLYLLPLPLSCVGLQPALHSILGSTHLCKFAIWACRFFSCCFLFLALPDKWQSHCQIMHVCMCVPVCLRVWRQLRVTGKWSARQTRQSTSITAPHDRGEKHWNIFSICLSATSRCLYRFLLPPRLSPLLSLSISLPFFPSLPPLQSRECVGAGSRYSRSPLVQSPALIG